MSYKDDRASNMTKEGSGGSIDQNGKQWKRMSKLDRMTMYLCTPEYIPSNRNWEITFRVLGFSREMIEKFWTVFCRINMSRKGEITTIEFLDYFSLDRSKYVEKCFDYFDTTGSHGKAGTVDFLEFVISVWNVCTLNCDTLTNFTFDLYDLDCDGELSLEELESLVHEVYGDLSMSPNGTQALKDIVRFAENRGGVLNLTSFAMYTANHASLMLPIFHIQQVIQRRVMGMKFWRQVDMKRPDKKNDFQDKDFFNPRHVQTLLRTYKTGGVAAMLTHTGDPNVALLNWYKENEETFDEEDEKTEAKEEPKFKYARFKKAVDKVKELNEEQKSRLKKVATTVKVKSIDAVDASASAFMDAGKKSRRSMARVAGSTIDLTTSVISRIRVTKNASDLSHQATNDSDSLESSSKGEKENADNVLSSAEKLKQTTLPIAAIRHKQRKPRPRKSASTPKRKKTLLKDRIGKLDIPHTSQLRQRQPGAIVYSITGNDSFHVDE